MKYLSDLGKSMWHFLQFVDILSTHRLIDINCSPWQCADDKLVTKEVHWYVHLRKEKRSFWSDKDKSHFAHEINKHVFHATNTEECFIGITDCETSPGQGIYFVKESNPAGKNLKSTLSERERRDGIPLLPLICCTVVFL